VLAVIPYTTFPTIDLGPLNLRTFGLMVALGVLLGSWVAAMYIERYGIPRDETYRVATYMVLAGIVGARLTWAATHTDQIHSLVDVIAIWEGGIQFSGGFIFALLVGLPFFRRWNRLQRWHVLDGYSLGLALGLAIGRIGCYAVGEHFGRTSSFFLATRYDGGDVREPNLGDQPLLVGTSFHNTALYEMLYMFLLFAILGGMVLLARRRGRELATGTIAGIFLLYYGIARFLSDSLRVNDERIAGLTGAQWMCIVMIPAGLWILWQVRPSLAEDEAEAAEAAEAEAEAEEAEDTEVEAEAEDSEIEGGGEPAPEPGDDDAYEPAEAGTDSEVSKAVPIGTTVDNASDEDEATVPRTER
jgi:phosphatidylglycerol:prolipoprotein diacylglycerol transferase